MLRRKVTDEVDARCCLDAVAASGLTRREWARREGVDARSLNAWRLNLFRSRSGGVRAASTGPLRLVELVSSSTPEPARYLVRFGDFEVEVDDHFDDSSLGRLLRVVAAC